jgi:uncharacterized protein (DUF952 family)
MTTTIFHLAAQHDWEQAEAAEQVYFPPTFEQDQMTHAAGDIATLIKVANQFYRNLPGPWLIIAVRVAALEAQNIAVKFEPAAPVGARDDHFEGSDAVLFPHIYGGIPTAAVESIGVLPKNDRGEFVDPGESESSRQAGLGHKIDFLKTD